MSISAMNKTSFKGNITVVTNKANQPTEKINTNSILKIENRSDGYSVITCKKIGKNHWNETFPYIESIGVLHPIETVLAAYNACKDNSISEVDLSKKDKKLDVNIID